MIIKQGLTYDSSEIIGEHILPVDGPGTVGDASSVKEEYLVITLKQN